MHQRRGKGDRVIRRGVTACRWKSDNFPRNRRQIGGFPETRFSLDSPRLIESMRKQPPPPLIRPWRRALRGNREKNAKQGKLSLLFAPPCVVPPTLPYPFPSLKRVSTTAPSSPLFFRTKSIIWFIYVWVTSSSWPIDTVWAYMARWWCAYNRFCNGSRANAPTSA